MFSFPVSTAFTLQFMIIDVIQGLSPWLLPPFGNSSGPSFLFKPWRYPSPLVC